MTEFDDFFKAYTGGYVNNPSITFQRLSDEWNASHPEEKIGRHKMSTMFTEDAKENKKMFA